MEAVGEKGGEGGRRGWGGREGVQLMLEQRKTKDSSVRYLWCLGARLRGWSRTASRSHRLCRWWFAWASCRCCDSWTSPASLQIEGRAIRLTLRWNKSHIWKMEENGWEIWDRRLLQRVLIVRSCSYMMVLLSNSSSSQWSRTPTRRWWYS